MSPHLQDLLAPHGISWQMGRRNLAIDMMIPNCLKIQVFKGLAALLDSLWKNDNVLHTEVTVWLISAQI